MVDIQREYVPGACNINKEEEARRLASGWLGVVLTVVLELTFLALQVPALWRLSLFFPAALAASGFLQVALHFCAAYGLKGVFNVSGAAGLTQSVEAEEARAKDRAKAILILVLSALDGALVAWLAYAFA